MNKYLPSLILSMGSLAAAQDACEKQPAKCNSADVCQCEYCLGPISYQGNAPVRPFTCDGDVVVGASIFTWKAVQDGMEYAIETNVEGELFSAATESEMNNIIDGVYKSPNFGWQVGYKAKVGYNSFCDGWDVSLNWAHYSISDNDSIQAGTVDSNDVQENVLITLWSAFHGIRDAAPVFAHRINSTWKLTLNLLDLELGREYWVSKYLTMRPFIALERAWIEQDFELYHFGGYWVGAASAQEQLDANNEVKIDNDYKGIGIRSGLSTNWHFGCGWSVFSQVAATVLSGHFSIVHDEVNRQAVAPFLKQKILDTKERFYASRAALEFILGLQYHTLICDCKYGIRARLDWEQHLFFHQNQMWRVVRADNQPSNDTFPNNGGENVFYQRRGTLGTQGWTLSFQFEF